MLFSKNDIIFAVRGGEEVKKGQKIAAILNVWPLKSTQQLGWLNFATASLGRNRNHTYFSIFICLIHHHAIEIYFSTLSEGNIHTKIRMISKKSKDD